MAQITMAATWEPAGMAIITNTLFLKENKAPAGMATPIPYFFMENKAPAGMATPNPY